MSTSALWCLRISVAAQCLATARTAWVVGSSVNGWLFMKAGLPETVASTTDQVATALLLVIAASVLLRPVRVLLLVSAAWMAAEALAIWANPGTVVDSVAPFAHAVRIAAPLGLAFLLPKTKRELFQMPSRSPLALWILLLGTSATFIAHGMEALQHYGRFVDLIIGSAKQWIGWDLSQSGAEAALTFIGIHDILLAALLLLRRWRWVAGWMALWGLATALSRMTAMGGDSWHQSVLRIANGGVPLAIYLSWWQLVRPSAPSPRK